MANAQPARAAAFRLTRTDACGVPVDEAVANSRITSAGFIQIGGAADIFRSNDIQVAGASGAICLRSKGVPSLLGYNVTLQICSFNVAALEMLLGVAPLVDGPDTVGGVLIADGAFNTRTVMLEWWSENANADACAGGNPYVQFVYPRVSRWTIASNIDVGNNETTISLEGYADPTTAFAPSRAVDPWTASDILAINAQGVLAWRETASLPTTVADGYDP